MTSCDGNRLVGSGGGHSNPMTGEETLVVDADVDADADADADVSVTDATSNGRRI